MAFGSPHIAFTIFLLLSTAAASSFMVQTAATAPGSGTTFASVSASASQTQAVQTINIAAGTVYQFGPSSGIGAATLGYAITSTTTFDVVLVNSANLNLLRNGQSFQYYAAYSARMASSATLRQLSFSQPEPLYLVIGTMSQGSLLATTVQANVAFLDGTCSLTLCQNGGLCTGGSGCSCAAGWSGATCSSAVCSPVCVGNRQCSSPNTCTCQAGWTGANCDSFACSPACLNGGTCTGPNTCVCAPRYSGVGCSDFQGQGESASDNTLSGALVWGGIGAGVLLVIGWLVCYTQQRNKRALKEQQQRAAMQAQPQLYAAQTSPSYPVQMQMTSAYPYPAPVQYGQPGNAV